MSGSSQATGYVVLNMWGPFRASLIKAHLFYVEQARSRLLSQFEGIEAEADKAAEDWLEESGQYFDPDRHDAGDFYEQANDVGIEFYTLLSDMREQTRLSVVAGMFHEWDKQLREWLVREIGHWHQGESVAAKVWSADFQQISELLEGFGWRLRETSYFSKLDACRLVVNVYKHGEGKSLDDLKGRFPEYLADPFDGAGGAFSGSEYRDHTHLKISDDQFRAFSEAIVAFWADVPENIFDTQITVVPAWLEKAVANDRSKREQADRK